MLAVAFYVNFFLFHHQFEWTSCPKQLQSVKGNFTTCSYIKTMKRRHFSPAALHMWSTTNQCLSTTANCNNVFRSTFTNQHWVVAGLFFFFFIFLNLNTVVRATCLFCAIKGLLQILNQNKGSLSAFTRTSIQILFQIRRFLKF